MSPELPSIVPEVFFIAAEELGRYLIVAGLFFWVFWILRWDRLRHRHIQDERPKRRRLHHEIKYSLITSAIFVIEALGVYLLREAGLTRFYADVSSHGWLYFGASIVVMIIMHDTYFYWIHRAMHHSRLFRFFHLVHHKSTNPSPWAAYSFAPPEAILQAAIGPIIVLTLPVHEVAMFVFLVFMIVMNVIGHLGIELYPTGWARNARSRWFLTSTYHNLHHRHFHGNYGLYFSFWDRLMGTANPSYEERYEEITSRVPERQVVTATPFHTSRNKMSTPNRTISNAKSLRSPSPVKTWR